MINNNLKSVLLVVTALMSVGSAIASDCFIRQCTESTVCLGPLGCYTYRTCEIIRTGVDCTNPGGPDNP